MITSSVYWKINTAYGLKIQFSLELNKNRRTTHLTWWRRIDSTFLYLHFYMWHSLMPFLLYFFFKCSFSTSFNSYVYLFFVLCIFKGVLRFCYIFFFLCVALRIPVHPRRFLMIIYKSSSVVKHFIILRLL